MGLQMLHGAWIFVQTISLLLHEEESRAAFYTRLKNLGTMIWLGFSEDGTRLRISFEITSHLKSIGLAVCTLFWFIPIFRYQNSVKYLDGIVAREASLSLLIS